ncbi:MAG: hypothetical protein K2H09_03340 [Treponemataceae bacterium]|nr:hypothetical protein [Treponemataceae bacterium]
MKRIVSFVGGALAAVSAAVLVSCNDAPSYDARTDTVINLDAPSVSAKAYPGVNYISWAPVVHADTYIVYRAAEGKKDVVILEAYGCECIDAVSYGNMLVDGVTYTYYVEATTSKTAGSITFTDENGNDVTMDGEPLARQVYLGNSRGSASVKAVVPAPGTSVFSLDGSYTKDAFAVSKAELKDGGIWLSFPAAAGFRYRLYTVDATAQWGDTAGGTKYQSLYDATVYQARFIDSYTAVAKVPVMEAGDKTVVIKVASCSDLYEPEFIDTNITVPVDSMTELAVTQTVSAVYLNAEVARISWKPAVLAGGAAAKPEFYKVYRKEISGDGSYVEVAGVKSGEFASEYGNQTATLYYVDDTVPNNTVPYQYYIVLTDGISFGQMQQKYLGVYEYNTVQESSAYVSVSNASCVASDDDNRANDIQLGFSYYANDTAGLAIYWASVLKVGESDGTYEVGAWTSVLPTSFSGYSGTVLLKDMKAGKYIFKLVSQDEGKRPVEALSSVVTVN